MFIQKGGCVYIITNKSNSVFYVGVTSDLPGRIKQHIDKIYPSSFSARYNCNKLVWYESYSQITEAIIAEKKIKGGNRLRKMQLVQSLNPEWNDLWENDVKWW